jgi:hypothetical protein
MIDGYYYNYLWVPLNMVFQWTFSNTYAYSLSRYIYTYGATGNMGLFENSSSGLVHIKGDKPGD